MPPLRQYFGSLVYAPSTAQPDIRMWVLFFFQAEDGIRDLTVTGVQTCALPISGKAVTRQPCGSSATYRDYHSHARGGWSLEVADEPHGCRVTAFPAARPYRVQIGRASCGGRV